MKNLLCLNLLLIYSAISICQTTNSLEKNIPKNAVYVENLVGLSFGINYERNLFSKSKYKLNAGIGISSMVPLFIPKNISCPINVNFLYGSVHHLEMGLMVLPTYWYSKNYEAVDFFGDGEIYKENEVAIPAFFRVGYRYQKDEGLFIKALVGPPLFNLNKSDPEFFNYNFISENNELGDVPANARMFLFLWPSIAVGKTF